MIQLLNYPICYPSNHPRLYGSVDIVYGLSTACIGPGAFSEFIFNYRPFLIAIARMVRTHAANLTGGGESLAFRLLDC
jgi:hypothetical protein